MGDPTTVAGLVAWYQASAITGLSDGATITTWADLSGNGYTLTAGGTPTYETGELNGKAAVRFNGASYFSNSSVSISQPFTVFAVIRTTALTSGVEHLLSSGPTVDVALFLRDAEKTAGLFANANLLDGAARAEACVYEAMGNGVSSSVGLNGSFANGSGGNAALIGVVVCADRTAGFNQYNGDLFELVIYSGALSDTDRATVRSYLADQYFIAVSGYIGGAPRLPIQTIQVP